MIGKIKKGKSFGGCIRYVMGKDNAEIIDSDGVLLGNQPGIQLCQVECPVELEDFGVPTGIRT